jgi:hypothetical protein
MTQYCRLGEHDCEDSEWIRQMQTCVKCYNISQLRIGGFAHKLQPVDHFRLTAGGYFFSEQTGYIKMTA